MDILRNEDKIVDTICQNLGCKKPLSTFETDRQLQRPRTWKYRFCRRCRQMPDNSSKSIVWRCRLCPELLQANTDVRGQYYCKTCGIKESVRRSKIRSRLFGRTLRAKQRRDAYRKSEKGKETLRRYYLRHKEKS